MPTKRHKPGGDRPFNLRSTLSSDILFNALPLMMSTPAAIPTLFRLQSISKPAKTSFLILDPLYPQTIRRRLFLWQ
jgi:hypothetical protein